MKNKLMVVLLSLVMAIAINTTVIAGQETKEKSCAGGCCSGNGVAMTKMQNHGTHKHGDVKKDSAAKKEEINMQVEYTCPMHSDIKSRKPGTCPKCGMELIKQKKSTMDSSCHKQMMGKVTKEEKTKLKLMTAGKYNCCIEDPCNMCIDEGGCNCKNEVKNNKPVCKECYEGWQHGKGNVSGKSAKDIKKEHDHSH